MIEMRIVEPTRDQCLQLQIRERRLGMLYDGNLDYGPWSPWKTVPVVSLADANAADVAEAYPGIASIAVDEVVPGVDSQEPQG